MSLLSIESISKQYGPRPLFTDVTFGMLRGERLGIIGVNGSGKTSLLRIAAGLEPPDTGRVVVANGVHIAYLPQAPELPPGCSVLEAVFAGDSPTVRLLREYEGVAAALEARPADQALLDRLSALTPQMDALGAWDAEAAARAIIDELGLAAHVNAPVDTLSGGQRKRVAMARALVDRPDLLILDEPTNHIDTDTVAWLEDYLARIPTALLLVTHDRYFLDRLVQRTLELDRGRVFGYQGNYERYLEQKAERLLREASVEEARQNLLRKELAWLRRGARARTTKQKAHVERVHDLMEQRAESAQGTVSIDVAHGRRLGKKVVELKGVSKGYGDRPLIKSFTNEIRPGDRVGIVGPNGAGKTTLLNLITGRVQPDAGVVVVGETVHMAYYDQEAAGLDEAVRVVDYIREVAELVRGREGALVASTQLLERFLFTSEQQWALVSTLSGGERRRLYLLRQLIESPNLLILDEPTNDLDLQTLNVLEDYLDEFPGAVIVVSHDRYFLDRVVRRTFAFEGDGRITEYPGGYTMYAQLRPAPDRGKGDSRARPAAQERRGEPRARPAGDGKSAAARREPHATGAGMQAGSGGPQSASAPLAPGTDDPAGPLPTGRLPTGQLNPPPRKLSTKERRELDQLEARIPQLEAERDQVAASLAATTDYQRLNALSEQLATLEAAIEEAFTRWAELSERA